jgi:hypothetical protein
MKLRSYVVLFFAVFAGSFFMASCLNDDNKIPDNCYDGILNNGEINIDCGGPNCNECDHCTNGIFEPLRGETWVDCGGECPVCPTCANGHQDEGEDGIDCGGTCGGCELLCDDGLFNGLEDTTDCENDMSAPYGGCPICPNCNDGLFNGDETGIDCGGPCDPCCSTGNCGNGMQDGAEFYIDCGGNSCPDCDTIFTYKIGSTVYNTPKLEFFAPIYDPTNLVLTYNPEPAYDSDPSAPPIQIGSMALIVTAPQLGWAGSLGAPLDFPVPFTDPTQYSLVWVDEMGYTYTSALDGGSCRFTIVKFKELAVTAQDIANGCNKPAGNYRFFRGVFQGTLVAVDPTAPMPTVNVTNGLFQFTFLP